VNVGADLCEAILQFEACTEEQNIPFKWRQAKGLNHILKARACWVQAWLCFDKVRPHFGLGVIKDSMTGERNVDAIQLSLE